MPRSSDGSAHHDDGPLIETPEEPEARNGLSRRGRLLGEFHGTIWGSPDSSADVIAQRDWATVGQSRRLVAPGDAALLANALSRAIGDEEHRERLATRRYDRFLMGYSADAMFPRVERIWLDAAETASRETVGACATARKGTP